ncbi:MAG TPA: L,D-transpeptidase family protein [Acidimicrobiales bacterium]|nr:L,D-transpeptidase family protein [Acidimicrobiales bacterium]
MSRRALPIGVAIVTLLLAASCSSSETGAPAVGAPASTEATVPPSTAPPTTVVAVPPQGLGKGDSGDAVRGVESRLAELHFEVGAVDGVFDDDTEFAVQAFQKLAGLPRDGRVTQAVVDKLAATSPPPPLVPGGGGTRVEIDLPRQLIFLYESDSLSKILTTSTATNQEFCDEGRCRTAVTPPGAFRVDYFKPGWDESDLGRLYNPVYFNSKDGIAIHGFPEVPPEPASHGCVRIPMSAAEWFHDKVPKGTPVYVLDGTTPVAPLAPDDPGAAGPSEG